MGRDQFTELLTQEYDDVLLLNINSIRKAATPKRLELIETIKTQDVGSIRELARRTGRNNNAVMHDLETLFELDIIAFENEANRKRPVLNHDNVFAKPLFTDINSNSGDEW